MYKINDEFCIDMEAVRNSDKPCLPRAVRSLNKYCGEQWHLKFSRSVLVVIKIQDKYIHEEQS